MSQGKLRVGVVFGSRSCEYNVSLQSAASVIANLDTDKYEVVPLAITREGTWLLGVEPAELQAIDEDKGEQERLEQNKAVALVGDPNVRHLQALGTNKQIGSKPLDVIFPVLHGPYGEDGTIQGLFEMADLPYVGCGVLGSAVGMDKAIMKMLFQAAGLPVIDYLVYRRREWEHEPETVISTVEQRFGYPCVVKPVNMGSSVGVNKASDQKALVRAITTAALYDSKVIIERCLNIRELSCAVLGNDEPIASLVGELVTEEDTLLDYEKKYVNLSFRFEVPANIPPELAQEIRQESILAYRTLDLSGLARIDFFLDRDDQHLYINEVNTLPGFTEASIYAKMWNASGLSYPQVLDRLIDLALERYQDRKRNRTS
jgi:D-alanine-D-alanine ligase